MIDRIDRIEHVWGTGTTYRRGELWPVRVDQKLAEGLGERDVDRWVQAACTLCSNGCACDIAVKDGAMVGVRGRHQDTVNHGRLEPKGLFGSWQGMQGKDRLTTPLIRRDGELPPTDWDTAMGTIVERSRALVALRDEDLLGVIALCDGEMQTQIARVNGRMRQAAPQALVVA